jgi:hypothetical protein
MRHTQIIGTAQDLVSDSTNVVVGVLNFKDRGHNQIRAGGCCKAGCWGAGVSKNQLSMKIIDEQHVEANMLQHLC